MNQEAAVLANELGANKQVLYLDQETARYLGRKVELLHAIEARSALLGTQFAESRVRLAAADA